MNGWHKDAHDRTQSIKQESVATPKRIHGLLFHFMNDFRTRKPIQTGERVLVKGCGREQEW